MFRTDPVIPFHPPRYQEADGDADDEDNCWTQKGCWWEPSKESLPVAYCRETSMHGLKYVTEPERHLSERIGWLLAFFVGVGAAAYLINDVWDYYYKNPVIVSFDPVDVDIGDIPFPAVTICNMNRFPKRLYQELLETYQNSEDDPAVRVEAGKHLEYVKGICGTQPSFSQNFDFAAHRGEIPINSSGKYKGTSLELFALMIEVPLWKTIPCEELIRLCMWSDEKRSCSELFKPIVTEYGKCCTFNMLPLPLLVSPQSVTRYNDPAEEYNSASGKPIKPRWDKAELNKWNQWDFNSDGNFILEPSMERPYRQVRAGVPFGLSILIDPNTDQYFCPSTDSEGFRMVLHTPLEMPPIQVWGFSVGTGKEKFLNVRPRLKIGDSKIFSFPYEKRKCYFQSEKTLKFFNAYSRPSCLEECIALLTVAQCNCAFYYMHRASSTRVCSSIPGSEDYKCVMKAHENATHHFHQTCPNCRSLCTDIAYDVEETEADLQNANILWMDTKKEVPSWANNNVTIVHLYYGVASIVPQLTSARFAAVDLIANTGGLLGLCLGFSGLSAVEFLYFFTVRFVWQKIRQRAMARRIANKFIDLFWKRNRHDGRLHGNYGNITNQNGSQLLPDSSKNIQPFYPGYSFDKFGEGQGQNQRGKFSQNEANTNNGNGNGFILQRDDEQYPPRGILYPEFYTNSNRNY